MEQPTAIDHPPDVAPTDLALLDVELEDVPSVAESFTVHDEGSANWVVRQIIERRAYRERVKDWAEREQRRADREEEFYWFRFGQQLRDWATAQIEKLKGRRRSICLPAGTLGFRKEPVKLLIDDEQLLTVWAKRACPQAIKIKEYLSKTAINEHFAETGEVPAGSHIESERDKFYVR